MTIWDRIYQNLIYQDRWQSILDGLGVTLIISLLAIVFSTIFGLVLCLGKLSKWKIFRWSAMAYITIIRGTPMVLQLLIIYYGVFARATVPPVLIASIAFGLNSSAYVAEIMRGGILAVDAGQAEAARSLGLNKTQAMIRVVMPQAIKNFLPTYVSEFIVLIKETAIVGYIALSDLTKVADLIKGRTYDPWIPMIAAAILYLIVTGILTRLFSMLERRLRQSDKR
ncbi:MAG TPA: amino acid ABC transporter permease [Ruminococcaceae bacterium]|nr:amino acid ABC transporter permease [Oscillospiraceae bacterium]